jgi:hypothetical protein
MRIIGNDPSTPRQAQIVASGTLPSGKPVVVNADGTVSVISQTTTSGTETLGTQFALPTTSGQQASFLGGTYDSVNKKAIITYRDVNNSSYGTAVVGTVGESSVTWGTPVVFESAPSQWTSCAFDSTNGKVVISYQDQSNSFFGTSIVGTVSGNSISFGTPVVFQSSETTYIDTSYDSSAGAVVVNFLDGTDASGNVIAGTVSGTSITFGTSVEFGNNGIYGRSVYHPEEQCTIIAWRDNSPSLGGAARALTVSGTTITLGTKVYYLSGGQANQNDIAYDSDSKKIVIICRDEVNTTYGSSIVGTVSGTTLTFASPVTFQSGSVDWMGIEGWFTGGVVMTYDDQSSGNKIILKYGTISGTTISWGTGLEVYSGTGNNGYTGWSMATDVGRLVLAYNANSDGKYRVYNPTFTSTSINLTSENYIGMSQGPIEVKGSAEYVGTPVVFESADTRFIASAFDTTNNKVVIAYRDQGNSEYSTAIVGTVSGNAISFGTPVVFSTSAISYMQCSSMCFDPDTGKVVIAYRDEGTGPNHGKAIVGTVSGTSISFGSAVVFEAAGSNLITTVYDTNSNKVVIAYKDDGNSEYGTAIVGTVSGTSISFGSPTVFNAGAVLGGTGSGIASTFDSTNNKVVLAYSDGSNSNQYTAIVGTVSGTSISFGTKVVIDTDTATKIGKGITAAYSPVAQKVLITYVATGNSDTLTARVGTVSGTSISFGTAASSGTTQTAEYDSVYNPDSETIVIVYKDESNSSYGTMVSASISGTDVTFGTPTVYYSSRADENAVVYDPSNNKTVAMYQAAPTCGKPDTTNITRAK